MAAVISIAMTPITLSKFLSSDSPQIAPTIITDSTATITYAARTILVNFGWITANDTSDAYPADTANASSDAAVLTRSSLLKSVQARITNSPKPRIDRAIPIFGTGPRKPRSRAGNITSDMTLAAEILNEVIRMLPCVSPKSPINSAIIPRVALIATDVKKTVRAICRGDNELS